jgi:hypothetical protein
VMRVVAHERAMSGSEDASVHASANAELSDC